MIESISVESALSSGRFSDDEGVSALLIEGVGPLSDPAHGRPPFPSKPQTCQNCNRFQFGSVVLNIADLAEHAIDVVPDRVVSICGDDRSPMGS